MKASRPLPSAALGLRPPDAALRRVRSRQAASLHALRTTPCASGCAALPRWLKRVFNTGRSRWLTCKAGALQVLATILLWLVIAEILTCLGL